MSSSNTETTTVEVVMPQMGVSVSEGTIVEWRKQVGDWVEYEEPIVDISTDKIDTEVPSPAAGRVAEIVVEPGTTVEVGTVLARLATDARPGQAHASEGNGAAASEPAAPASEAAAAQGQTPVESTPTPSPEPGTAAPADAPRSRRASSRLLRSPSALPRQPSRSRLFFHPRTAMAESRRCRRFVRPAYIRIEGQRRSRAP